MTPNQFFVLLPPFCVPTENDLEFPDVETPHFWAARILPFQLFRNLRTRNMIVNVLFLIPATPNVIQMHRDTLNRGKLPGFHWSVLAVTGAPNGNGWNSVLAKLNLDRIFFVLPIESHTVD